MKFYIIYILFLMAIIPAMVQAQDNREDVIYLKSGTIYRGTIVEQIPNVSYKIELFGGSIIVVQSAYVEKVTKEEKIYVALPKRVFSYRDKGYFFKAKVFFGSEFSLHIINGYKFGQFGELGIGVGVEGAARPVRPGSVNTEGVYIPIFLHYGGDILRRQITPYYSIYAGYGFATSHGEHDHSMTGGEYDLDVQGGIMGGVSLGCRFYTKRRVNFTVAANLTIQDSKYWTKSVDIQWGYGPFGQGPVSSTTSYDSREIKMIMPSISLGIGF